MAIFKRLQEFPFVSPLYLLTLFVHCFSFRSISLRVLSSLFDFFATVWCTLCTLRTLNLFALRPAKMSVESVSHSTSQPHVVNVQVKVKVFTDKHDDKYKCRDGGVRSVACRPFTETMTDRPRNRPTNQPRGFIREVTLATKSIC